MAADLETLCAFPFLSSTQVIDGLKSELPKCVAASEDLSKQVDFIQRQSSHETDLPNWAKACRLITSQVIFSSIRKYIFYTDKHFSSQQESSLEDYSVVS